MVNRPRLKWHIQSGGDSMHKVIDLLNKSELFKWQNADGLYGTVTFERYVSEKGGKGLVAIGQLMHDSGLIAVVYQKAVLAFFQPDGKHIRPKGVFWFYKLLT